MKTIFILLISSISLFSCSTKIGKNNIEKGKVLHHKNLNPFDFRVENLIELSRSELSHIVGTSNQKHRNYKGVSYNCQMNQWEARIINDNKVIHGSYYKSAYDASIEADYLIIQHFGIE